MPDGDRVPDGLVQELSVLGARSRWARNGDVDVHALDYGGNGHPCVVLPGITSPAITWDSVAAPLRDIVRPVVVDLRGRGLSGLADSYRVRDFADDAAALIRRLQLERPIVVGHSLGARIAAALAASSDVTSER